LDKKYISEISNILPNLGTEKKYFVSQEATTEAMLRQTTGAHYSDP
jgi:hypothetical protein